MLRHPHHPVSHSRPKPANDVPLLVRFQRQTPDAYAVCDLDYGDIVTVPKSRALPEAFPPTLDLPVVGVRVLRWSGVALALAVLGGAGGIVIGVFCLLAALAGLARFGQRARRWRAKHPGEPLPAVARAEHDRLRGARSQALLAIVIGLGIFALITGNMR
jgi:hypothetical protein